MLSTEVLPDLAPCYSNTHIDVWARTYNHNGKELTSFAERFQHLPLLFSGLSRLFDDLSTNVDKVMPRCHCILLTLPSPSVSFQCLLGRP